MPWKKVFHTVEKMGRIFHTMEKIFAVFPHNGKSGGGRTTLWKNTFGETRQPARLWRGPRRAAAPAAYLIIGNWTWDIGY
ncbi:MAG: hypothetical protein KBC66_04675 [Kiritimatiellae bacterium]|jgi:hypothetical protein|nr:hypothetical protein [Kiritimatiellia bacterium]HPC19730.1 hypothetical protein [Kiritimatiellia bacterium]HQN80994.1 hypothetical protein [Kiritimatiellia bacterium]HQQ59826.1 hypothetical protein [Kiritimatiellia bacterium]